ncbi:alpha/beta hydrolase family protein [Pseudomonas sp. NPDC087358]|uniref:alpha/beta hydrolase family protein n=1 Tax=Pseudomonas sp. NPDC087358 TaxID=3364439 RepID=UPI00384D6812
MNNLINMARHIPVNQTVPAVSISQVTLPSDTRLLPLELRVTAPITGDGLAVILLSHGHGPSLYLPSKDGYGPLVNFLAEHGFVVIQPTHLNSKVAGLDAEAPGGPLFWRSRTEDMTLILDRLDDIETQVPFLAGRIDHSKVGAVGHSLGGHTIGLLLGARVSDPEIDGAGTDMSDRRIKAGVLLAPPGSGGKDLSEFAAAHYPALGLDFAHMHTSALVVVGDNDVSPHLTIRGADWHADPYHRSPGTKSLLTLIDGKHGLGGIAGYDAAETQDENPDRLAAVQRLAWAYLRSELYSDDSAWQSACTALALHASALGHIEHR